MANNILLVDLIDPLSPSAISYLPQTTGWKCLAVLSCMACAIWLFRKWRDFKRQAYRRKAKKRVEQLMFDSLLVNEPKIMLHQLNQITKQAAMQLTPIKI